MTVKQFRDTELTNVGFSIANKAALGKTQYTTTRAVSTDVDLSGYKTEDLKNLTKLPGEINSGIITDYDMPGNNVSAIKINFNNNGFKDGYIVRAVALYAKENGSSDEFLHSITVTDTPVNIPAISGNVFTGFYLTLAIFSGNNKNINIKLSDETAATVKYVDEQIAKVDLNGVLKQANAYADGILSAAINQINANIGVAQDAAGDAMTVASKANALAAQAQATAYAGLQFKGDMPSDNLYKVQKPGIYNLAGKRYKDWNNQQMWGNFVVIDAGGGVVTQFIYNNVNNCWVQTCNSWGNTGFKSVY